MMDVALTRDAMAIQVVENDAQHRQAEAVLDRLMDALDDAPDNLMPDDPVVLELTRVGDLIHAYEKIRWPELFTNDD